MVVGSRGYVFTLITAFLVMITLSLILFSTQMFSPSFQDSSNQMSLNELHYFVESVKGDAGRAIAISASRAATYSIDHTITTNETYAGYEMRNCTDFTYPTPGAEAALSELIICGRLEGSKKPSQDIEKFMENNTLLDWLGRFQGNETPSSQYNVSVRFKNMSIALYDSWHLLIVSQFDFVVWDTQTGNRYTDYNVPVTSVVDVRPMEDTLPYLHYSMPATLRPLTQCLPSKLVNGSVLDDWIDSGCYQQSSRKYAAPSFLDRLEGRQNLSQKFIDRSAALLDVIGYPTQDIGIEGFMNLELLNRYNVSVNGNLSQIDYMYWNNVATTCFVDGMVRHPDFRIDAGHAVKYAVKGLDCVVTLDNLSGTYYYSPNSIIIPVDASITFVERSGTRHELYSIPVVSDNRVLYPYSILKWKFNQTGDYYLECVDHGETMLLHVTNGTMN